MKDIITTPERTSLRNDLDGKFQDYNTCFVQRTPSYVVKTGGQWITRRKALADPAIKAHLRGQYFIATLGRWYPVFCILDVDSRSREEAEDIRSRLGLNEVNSMLSASESKDSFHIIFQVLYKGRPLTLRLLQVVLKNFGWGNGIEVYPQETKAIRLPFGSKQACLDYQHAHLKKWEEKFSCFQKFSPLELSEVRGHDMIFDFAFDPPENRVPGGFGQGKELLEFGLQGPSTRENGQFNVLLYLFRSNIPQEQAEGITWNWIQKKNNGYSKEIVTDPFGVRKHISRQAENIYSGFEISRVYPDSTHNSFHGWISEPDLEDIVSTSKASLPRMKFLFELVKYCNPRRRRPSIQVHRDKLIEWSGTRTYQKWLEEMESEGLLKRQRSYHVGYRSKAIKLNWDYRDSSQAVLFEGRSINDFKQTVRTIFKPDDFRQLVNKAAKNRKVQYKVIKAIWK